MPDCGAKCRSRGRSQKELLSFMALVVLGKNTEHHAVHSGEAVADQKLQVTVICAKEQARQSESAKDCLV